MSDEKTLKTKLVTTKVRFSYAHVFQAVAMAEGQEKKYSVSLLISKKDKALIKKVNDAIAAALEAGKTSKFGGAVPKKGLKMPLRDGDVDRDEDEVYKGHFFITASSKRRPQVVDAELNPIIDEDEFYSGCYGRASINFYAFNSNGNKGVACGLNNIQKLEEGEALSGVATAEEDFSEDDLMG